MQKTVLHQQFVKFDQFDYKALSKFNITPNDKKHQENCKYKK